VGAEADIDIVLATINAKYAHASFALRYLRANLGDLRDRSEIVEFTHQTKPLDMAERLLARSPRIIGLSVYIWNVEATTELVAALKGVRPDIAIVLGGPEVSYELDTQPVVALADAVVTGEGEAVFPELCRRLIAGESPQAKVITGGLPDLTTLRLPYDEYSETDIADRIVYVEASRGCPFKCEFCLSSLDVRVRNFPLDTLLAELQRLLDRGVRRFKFIDRTFNLKVTHSARILQWFLDRHEPGLFVHFEMIPDRLPAALRDIIRKFPPGALQFEVGVQTLDPLVSGRISRRQDVTKLADNLRFLQEETGVHVHTDLIVGLPGEDLATFAAGFDRLHALGTQEIQVGILKRLRGTPIVRHTDDFAMVYSTTPPYEVLQTAAVDFATMQRLKRFALVWDRTVNRGNFVATAPLLWDEAPPFAAFLHWSDWLHEQHGQVHSLALKRLSTYLDRYLVQVVGHPQEVVDAALAADIERRSVRRSGLERQQRHAALGGKGGPVLDSVNAP